MNQKRSWKIKKHQWKPVPRGKLMAAFDIINPDRELSREAKLVKEKSKKEQENMEFHLRKIKGNLEAKIMPEFDQQLSAKLDNVDLLEQPEPQKKDQP